MVKKISIPIYLSYLIIIQVKKLKDMPKKYQPEDYDFTTCGAITCIRTTNKGYKQFIVAFEKPIDIGSISHEAVHCANMIFTRKEIEHNRQNDEHFAYLVGWITNKCLKYLKIKKWKS